MKDFMKMVGATIVGLLVFSIIISIFSIIGIAGVVATESSYTAPENSILRINLNAAMNERDEQSPLDALMGGGNGVLALDQMLTAIDKAAKTEDVKGIYLEGGALSGNPAMLQELRQALVEFKKTGKFIIAYGDNYSQGAYYVCSVANEILVNPSGMIDWHGLGSQSVFFTETMEKLGVKMQVFKVGTFKSAVEPFINTEMSEPNRQQVTSYLSSIWNGWVKDVAASRKLTEDKVNELADSMTTFLQPIQLLEAKMADKICYRDEVKDLLKKKMKMEEDDDLTFVSYTNMANAVMDIEKHSDRIAVYYAYGDIVDDNGGNALQGGTGIIAPNPMNSDLQRLLEDEDVKAVVIRVNSGGGSAYASEQIWHQIELLKEQKPVVVSMGGMAASGGYYISSGANKIIAEPSTLTGSIGIFGMFPDMSELLTEKVGLHFDVVKTNKYADFGNQARPINEDEARKLQAYINNGYDLFTRRVAEGRGISQDSVKVIAEGRVWTGEQAKKLGLVDELGNLQDAIKAAAKLAKTKEYNVATYPETKSLLGSLMGDQSETDYMDIKIQQMMGDYAGAYRIIRQLGHWNPVQARLPYDIVVK